jgi:glycosyltransferase involved in cell wall biosynthesis
MASGVPVISSRACGAARTVIQDGVSGILVDIDVVSISCAISRLFRMTPEQRADMGVAAAEAISDWGPERFGLGMRAAVDSACVAQRRGRIPLWDRVILAQLQKSTIETVA